MQISDNLEYACIEWGSKTEKNIHKYTGRDTNRTERKYKPN